MEQRDYTLWNRFRGDIIFYFTLRWWGQQSKALSINCWRLVPSKRPCFGKGFIHECSESGPLKNPFVASAASRRSLALAVQAAITHPTRHAFESPPSFPFLPEASAVLCRPLSSSSSSSSLSWSILRPLCLLVRNTLQWRRQQLVPAVASPFT